MQRTVTIVTKTFVPYMSGESPEWVKYELNDLILNRIIAEQNHVRETNLNAVELGLGIQSTWPDGWSDVVYEAVRIDANGFAVCAVVDGGALYVESTCPCQLKPSTSCLIRPTGSPRLRCRTVSSATGGSTSLTKLIRAISCWPIAAAKAPNERSERAAKSA